MACAPLWWWSEVAAEATSTTLGSVWCLFLVAHAPGGSPQYGLSLLPASSFCFPVVYMPMP